MWMSRIFFVLGCAMSSAAGVQVWNWFTEPFPVTVHHRYVLTPKVTPDNDALIGLSVYRGKNCPVTVRRRLLYPDGSYFGSVELKDKEFGPVGPDEYTMRVPIASNAPFGRAKLWSEACSACNVVQAASRYLEKCAPPTTDEFEIGDRTIRIADPEGFDPSREVVTPNK